MTPMPAVYRHFDSKGRLLYIGCSATFDDRQKAHFGGGSSWARRIARIEVQRYQTMTKAVEMEKRAIQRERPLHNIQHNNGHPKVQRQLANKRKELDRVIRLAGGVDKLAAILTEHTNKSCTRQAIQQWHKLPELREFQLREIKPEWFKSAR